MTFQWYSAVKQNSIIRSWTALGLVTLIIKVFGYIEKLVLSYLWGTGYNVDAYNVIVTIILSLVVFTREVIEPGFLNTFLLANKTGKRLAAWNLFTRYAFVIVTVTISLSLLVYLNPAIIIRIFSPGFNAIQKLTSIKLLQLSFPACIFLSLATLTSITLNAYKRFAFPAAGDALFKASIIFLLLLGYRFLGIYAAALGLIAGALVKLTLHVFGLSKELTFQKSEAGDKLYAAAWKLTIPVIIGITFSLVSGLADNIIASYHAPGSISALSYARKLADLPVTIFPYILSIVVFPYFTDYAIDDQTVQSQKLLRQSLKWIVIVFLPLSIFFTIFSYEITEILLKRGAFGVQSVALTAKPLMLYSTGMIFFALESILVIYFFANGDTKTPIILGICCSGGNIALALLLSKLLGYSGIALALVISKTTKTIILGYRLRQRESIPYRISMSSALTFIFPAALAAGMIYACKILFYHQPHTMLVKAGLLVLFFLIAGLSYGISIFWIKKALRVFS